METIANEVKSGWKTRLSIIQLMVTEKAGHIGNNMASSSPYSFPLHCAARKFSPVECRPESTGLKSNSKLKAGLTENKNTTSR